MKKYMASNNYILRIIAGQPVLVSVGAGVADFRGVIQLNETAKSLWEMLKTGATKDDLVAGLTAGFDASKEQVEVDVDQMLTMLVERGMVSCE